MDDDNPGVRTMYLIIHADGRIHGSGKSAGTLFKDKAMAQNKARAEGDSVVPVEINLRKEPVFIRRKTL